jgi:hypothetical protein
MLGRWGTIVKRKDVLDVMSVTSMHKGVMCITRGTLMRRDAAVARTPP